MLHWRVCTQPRHARESQAVCFAAVEGEDEAAAKPAKAAVVQRPWPTGLTEQIKAVAEVVAGAGRSLDLEGLAAHFNGRGRWRDSLPALSDTLVALGRVRVVDGGRYSAGPKTGRWRLNRGLGGSGVSCQL